MKPLTFNPSISFDGVAIIIACITCSIWFGSLKETVKQHTEILQHHERILEQLSESQKVTAQNIAVLTTIVNAREHKGAGNP